MNAEPVARDLPSRPLGRVKAPAAPLPGGSLVQSDGTAYAVMIPYMCGKVIPVK